MPEQCLNATKCFFVVFGLTHEFGPDGPVFLAQTQNGTNGETAQQGARHDRQAGGHAGARSRFPRRKHDSPLGRGEASRGAVNPIAADSGESTPVSPRSDSGLSAEAARGGLHRSGGCRPHSTRSMRPDVVPCGARRRSRTVCLCSTQTRWVTLTAKARRRLLRAPCAAPGVPPSHPREEDVISEGRAGSAGARGCISTFSCCRRGSTRDAMVARGESRWILA